VAWFRRRQPLHRKLAEQGGLRDDLDWFEPRAPAVPAAAAAPPGFDGEARGAAGIHGVPRRRRWDLVTTVEVPEARGDAVQFAALPDGTLVVGEEEPAEGLSPLADAVERTLQPPYRAEAVRRAGTTWAVAARTIEVTRIQDLDGDEAELAVTDSDRVLRVDGRTTFGSVPELERVGQERGSEYVVRARRLDGQLWEVETSAL
jgi:hypothetical protein